MMNSDIPQPAAGDAVRDALRRAADEIASGDYDGGVSVACYSQMQAALSASPAPVVPEGWRDLVQSLVDYIEGETCLHENTHRGGAIWEICDDCDAKWADDQGGKPAFKWPDAVERANAMLAAAPKAEGNGHVG